MKITSWNINSVRRRIELINAINQNVHPDILCLQECKAQESDFPFLDIKSKGYEHIVYYGMKAYNGVAICSKFPILNHGIMNWTGKEDARHIWADIQPYSAEAIRIHNVYIPAGGDIPDAQLNPKFAHKIQFVEELAAWSQQEISQAQRQVILGDFNIAPSEYDVWSHKQLLKIITHTPQEVELLTKFQQSGGWVDAIRSQITEPEKIFSWWSYRSKDWRKSNRGRRLDHIWLTADLLPHLQAAEIFDNARDWDAPSDHCPVSIELT
ncbi:MAG: exodeoxyribonuclease III [Alphaproteobacteria bacterium]